MCAGQVDERTWGKGVVEEFGGVHDGCSDKVKGSKEKEVDEPFTLCRPSLHS